MPVSFRQVLLFIRLSRPQFLLGGALLYGLGGAIADYLGKSLDPITYLLGQVIITFIQLMTQYLNEYYDSEKDLTNTNRTPLTGGSGVLGPEGLPKNTALYAAAFSLALAATAIILLRAHTTVPFVAWGILILGFLGAFFYNIPPIRLITSGYGEITTSFLVAGLLPSFAYSLQTGQIHRFLIMSSTPLIALCFAMLIAFAFPDYATDLKLNKRTLLVRVDWKMGMRLHNIAIIFAAVSILVAFYLGLPRPVALGSLIALPLAIAQIWQMDRIRQGYPTRWRIFTYNALALFVLTAYLEMIGYLLN
jgi:1,4-dihydroxy-2-naphthoate octaprenyltransferase